MPTRRYLDTSVLMLAWSKSREVWPRAIAEMELHPDTVFLYSRILELELLPTPTRNKQTFEVEFYKTFLEEAEFVDCTLEAIDIALDDALKVGMSAADALHVGCAAVGKADELVCAESCNKPLPKATAVTVRTIEY